MQNFNRCAFIAGLLWFCQPYAIAKEAVEHTLYPSELVKLSLDDLFKIKVKVASKTLENLFDTPASVTVFTHRELQAMGLNSVEEVLNFVPGFFSVNESVLGSGYMVSARGRTSPQASYNILFLLDGERLNDEISGGALAINHYIPLQNVKQIEIIRGPGSALYGTSAFLGVVNIISDDADNRVFLSAGELNSREAYVQVSEHNENWGFSAFARYFGDAGSRYPGALSSDDPRRGRDAALSLHRQRFDFKLRYLERQVAFPQYPLATDTAPNLAHSEQTTAYLEYSSPKSTKHDWNMRLGYMRQSTNSLLRDPEVEAFLQPYLTNEGLTPEQLAQAQLISGELAQEQAWHFNVDGHYVFNAHHEIFAGLTGRRANNDKFRFQGNFDKTAGMNVVYNNTNPVAYYEAIQVGEAGAAEGFRTILSIYAQSKHSLTEQVSATLGARYDQYSDFGHSINPRLALLYSPVHTTQLKFLYGEAFRAPSLRQLSGSDSGNPNLTAEKIKTAELAWLQSYPAQKLQTTLTYFHNWHSGLIDTVPVAGVNIPLRIFVNLPDTLQTSGWELEANTQLWDNFSLRLAYSYMNETETNPRRFPKQTLALMLNYQWQNWNFNLNTYFHDDLEYQFNRKKTLLLDANWQVNATLRYHIDRGLYLVGRVNNLLDETSYSSSKISGLPYGLPNRGRSANLGVEFNW